MKGILMLALVAWPLVSWGQAPVYKCEIEGRTVYQGAACPEGTMVDGWNLPEITTPDAGEDQELVGQPSEPTPEQEAVAAELRAQLEAAARGIQGQDGLPRLDVETRCNRVASVGGGFSQVSYNTCLENEQSAYDMIQPSFTDVPSEVRQRCLRVATVGQGGSYWTLRECIYQEAKAAINAPEFEH